MINFFQNLSRVYVIAEVGVNHNGDINLAKKIIDIAKSAGADAVKFQTFKADTLALKDTPKAAYQKNTTEVVESHYEMLKKLELSYEAHEELFAYANNVGLHFLSTPYDLDSAIFLHDLGVPLFKTASADIVDLRLHKFIASTLKPVIIATGMSTISEIDRVLSVYRKVDSHNVTLLHCVSNYPCSDQSLNMLSINYMSNIFGLPIGFSDHSMGSLAAIMAVALGCQVVEKHITFDKKLKGPDHVASSDPQEFISYVKNIRRAEEMLGQRIKDCQPEEREMALVSRKSIVFARNMSPGDIVQDDDLLLRRPGTGLDSSWLPQLVGKSLRCPVSEGKQIRLTDIEHHD